jgi:hypothetical protein
LEKRTDSVTLFYASDNIKLKSEMRHLNGS